MCASVLNKFYLNRKLALNALIHVGSKIMFPGVTLRAQKLLVEVLKLLRSVVSSWALFGKLRPCVRISQHTYSNIARKVDASLQNKVPFS